jgi:hypothetical protein
MSKIVPMSDQTLQTVTSSTMTTTTTINSNSKNKLIKIFMETIGWAGSLLVLFPYVITFDKTVDFILNTTGATGLLIVCITSRQYQSIVINAAWIIGGIYKYFTYN